MQSKKGKLGNGDNHSTAIMIKWGNNGEDIKLAMTGKNHKQTKLGIEYNILTTKPTWAANKIIEGHIPLTKGDTAHPPVTIVNKDDHHGKKSEGRVLPCKLLDGRQGKFLSLDMEISKSSSNMDISRNGGNKAAPTTRATSAGEPEGHVLLCPPII